MADEMRANNSLALEREGAACSFRAGQRGGVKEAGVSDFLQAAHVFSDRALSAGGARIGRSRGGIVHAACSLDFVLSGSPWKNIFLSYT